MVGPVFEDRSDVPVPGRLVESHRAGVSSRAACELLMAYRHRGYPRCIVHASQFGILFKPPESDSVPFSPGPMLKITDSSGRFVFNVPAGNYIVRGVSNESETVTVDGGADRSPRGPSLPSVEELFRVRV
jgi:hypothetical protein